MRSLHSNCSLQTCITLLHTLPAPRHTRQSPLIKYTRHHLSALFHTDLPNSRCPAPRSPGDTAQQRLMFVPPSGKPRTSTMASGQAQKCNPHRRCHCGTAQFIIKQRSSPAKACKGNGLAGVFKEGHISHLISHSRKQWSAEKRP